MIVSSDNNYNTPQPKTIICTLKMYNYTSPDPLGQLNFGRFIFIKCSLYFTGIRISKALLILHFHASSRGWHWVKKWILGPTSVLLWVLHSGWLTQTPRQLFHWNKSWRKSWLTFSNLERYSTNHDTCIIIYLVGWVYIICMNQSIYIYISPPDTCV